MPIKPENKKLYPENWKQISKRIRFERAKNKCEVCGAENYKPHPEKHGFLELSFCQTGGEGCQL